MWTAYERQTSTGTPQWWFTKDDRRVSCYYFYLWDLDFGPAFVKICTYFPYPAKIWINGHEWAKRQAAQAGIGFSELSNGFGVFPLNESNQFSLDRPMRWGSGVGCVSEMPCRSERMGFLQDHIRS